MAVTNPELLVAQESLAERIYSYLPSPEVLRDYPRPLILERRTREEAEKEIPGADYALVTSRLDSSHLVIVPYHHPENALPAENPGEHYSHVAFEGISLVPVVGPNGELIGANIVLFYERMQRMRRSMRALAGGIPTEEFMNRFEEGTLDLSAILCDSVLKDKDGNATRAYSRPAYVRLGPYSVAPKRDCRFHLSDIEWNWSLYKKREVYEQGAIAVVFLDAQRNERIYGKLAGNYIRGGVLTQIVEQDLGGNEVLFLGPYIIDGYDKKQYMNYQDGEEAKSKLLESGMPVDGSGEDVLFEDWNGNVFYQPMDTNILGGTTREYIIHHLAPKLGINVSERSISFKNMRKKDIVGMAYVGNAVKILLTRRIDIYSSQEPEGDLLETLELTLSPSLMRIQERLGAELFSKIEPSHPSLLTQIDIVGGRRARRILDERIYPAWF